MWDWCHRRENFVLISLPLSMCVRWVVMVLYTGIGRTEECLRLRPRSLCSFSLSLIFILPFSLQDCTHTHTHKPTLAENQLKLPTGRREMSGMWLSRICVYFITAGRSQSKEETRSGACPALSVKLLCVCVVLVVGGEGIGWEGKEWELFGSARECVGGCVGVRVSGCRALFEWEHMWLEVCGCVCAQTKVQSMCAQRWGDCVFPSPTEHLRIKRRWRGKWGGCWPLSKALCLSFCCMLIYMHVHAHADTHRQLRRLSNPVHSRVLEHTEPEWWDECREIQLKREDKSQGDI